MAETFNIRFVADDAGRRATLAKGLQKELEFGVPAAKVKRKKERGDTQDIGTILSIVLAAPAVVALVGVLRAYVLRARTEVVLTFPNGTKLTGKQLASADAPDLISAAMGERKAEPLSQGQGPVSTGGHGA